MNILDVAMAKQGNIGLRAHGWWPWQLAQGLRMVTGEEKIELGGKKP